MILDASVLVAAEGRTFDLEAMLRSAGGEAVALAAITASELLHGCHRARDAEVAARRWAWVEALLHAIPLLPFALPEARRHAALWAELARQGEPIGPHDMLVGATALAAGYAVATLNREAFGRIPGLRLADTKRFELA